jgi:hypothetical protein
MHEGVDESFPESSPVIIRNRNPEESHLNFLLLDTSFEKHLDFLESAEQRFPEKLVDLDISAFKYLESDFMGGTC